ncbi:MAG TPA: magnesium chelatase, partial [Candidatus Dormibacteraeota bacterium]
LKDRFGSQVRTHYPLSVPEEIEIMEGERTPPGPDVEVLVPAFMKEIVAEITHHSRRSPHISQSSGVSVRMSIGNYENLVSNAIRRSVRLGESLAVPRVSDLQFLVASTAGRVEVEALDEGKEEQVLARIQRSAINAVFGRHFTAGQFEWLVQRFEDGISLEVGEATPASAYLKVLKDPAELQAATKRLGLPEKAEAQAAVLELVLEGLHLNKRLNKDEMDGKVLYRR